MDAKFKPAIVLSLMIVVLAMVASAGGLWLPGLYRDNAQVTAAWRGNDLVTLAVAAPLLVVGLILFRRGSLRGLLVWLGMLGYMLYNYLFYLFGAALNEFFLIYVALVSISIFALIFSLPRIDARAIAQRFGPRTPVGWVAGLLLLFIVPWGLMEISRALSFIFTGQVPADVAQTGHPTAVVYALDLTLIAPFMVLAAIWLCQRRPWGYVLGVIMVLKGVAYPLALIAMSFFAQAATGQGDSFLPVYIGLLVGCLIAAVLLFSNMRRAAP